MTLSFIDETGKERTIEVFSSFDYYESDTDTSLLEKITYYDLDMENLDTKMLTENIGYINISNEMYAPFKGAISYLTNDASYVTNAVDEELEQLKNKGMKKLIIDLRSNDGGYEIESVDIASLFEKNSYIVSKTAKVNSKLYDCTKLKGNGKYSNMETVVLVNINTGSAGDILADLLSRCENVTLVGFTSSNNSAQSIGGRIYLSGGTSYINYPIYGSYNKDNTFRIDTDDKRLPTIKVDEKVKLTKDNTMEIINDDNDYLLNYAIDFMK